MRKPKKKPDSFVGSERHSLNGLHLEPWTEARRIAAQTLGIIYPNLNKADWASVKRGGAYPGAVRDIMLTLWLCSIPSAEILNTETAGIENAMEKSVEFGIKHGLHDIAKAPFWEGFTKCMEMWNEVNDSVTVPEQPSSDDDDSGND